MKTNIWLKKKITVYIGGDPEKSQPPIITLEMDNPQIQFDTDKYTMVIFETK
jgi:hypothetical protein